MFQFTLKDVIDSNNGDEEDVLNLKQNLQDLGYYKTPHYGMTGYTDEETFNGIKRFQKDHGLVADGVLKPGGETETALNERLKARESRSTAGNENDSRLENLRNSYQDKLPRKNLLSDSPQAQPSRAHRQTEEDTWGKLPETKDNKPLFEQQEEAAKPATMPQPSLQPDNLLTSETDKLDGRMQQLHERYRDTLVRRNLLAPATPTPPAQKTKNLKEGKINTIKEIISKATEVYKKSNAKNPISTGNKILDYGIGRIPLVKEWNKGFNIGKAAFITKQTYDELSKSKNKY